MGSLSWGDMLYRRQPFFRVALKGKQWPNATVYYEYEDKDEYPDDDMDLIKQAMAYIEEKSCVKFVERTDQPYFVQIRALIGCNAEVGYMAVARQQLVLDWNLCMTKGIILHELMHVLGFLHEQSRSDRDKYIVVHYENIIRSKRHNYNKSCSPETDHFGKPYDPKSVMHYYYNDYAIDGSKPTMTSKNESVKLSDFGEGKRNGYLSEIDIEKLNKYYNCQ